MTDQGVLFALTAKAQSTRGRTMPIHMTNALTKRYLVKSTGMAIFGPDFDYRKSSMPSIEAEKRFDTVWQETIERVIAHADPCDVELVREHVKGKSATHINSDAIHRHFDLDGKFFIAQLPSEGECDQLWLIPSGIRDPWTIYVKFAEVPIKQRFEKEAKKLGWSQPEHLAEKLLLDFLESVTKEDYNRGYLSEVSR